MFTPPQPTHATFPHITNKSSHTHQVSAADSYLDDPGAVVDLLNALIKTAQRKHQSQSNLTASLSSSLSLATDAAAGTGMGANSARYSAHGMPPPRVRSPPLESPGHANPFGTFSRVLSEGNLGPGPPSASPRVEGAKGQGQALARNESSAHLTIGEYMEGIQSGDAQDDNESLFF